MQQLISPKNKQIVLTKRFSGMVAKDCFRLENIELPKVIGGEVLVESLYISVDPGMSGFMDEWEDFQEAKSQLADWLISNEIKYKENFINGFINLPEAFIGLFEGDNIGKQMVKI